MFASGRDLAIVPCHSMNAGLVVGILKVAGTNILLVQARSPRKCCLAHLKQEPPSELFTTFHFICGDIFLKPQ